MMCCIVDSGGEITVVTSHPHPLRRLKKLLCRSFFNLILSLSTLIKIYDVPIEMSG